MEGYLGNIQGRGTCRGSRVPVGTWDVVDFIKQFFKRMSISPQGIVEIHALLEDFLLLNQLPGAIFLHSTYSFIVVNKNINRTNIIIITIVNTRISWAETMQILDGADHQ